jgi:hypothetical protein
MGLPGEPPLGAAPIYEWGWTMAPGIFPSSQAPALAALPDRTLIACWPAGSAEKASDVQIYCGRSRVSARGWEQLNAAVQSSERAQGSWLKNLTLGNPVLFLDAQRYL